MKNQFKLNSVVLICFFLWGSLLFSAKANNISGTMRTVPYLQSPTHNSMVVRWVSSLDCYGNIEYCTDSLKVVQGKGIKIRGGKDLIHRIKLNDLSANTRYYYRVFNAFYTCDDQQVMGEEYSEIYSFKTIPDSQDNLRILIFNDLHANFYTHILEELMQKISPSVMGHDLVIFNGDCLDYLQKEEENIYWIDRFAKWVKNSHVPSIYVPGNHEYDCFYRNDATCFSYGDEKLVLKKYLDFAQNGQTYGLIKFGDMDLLVLDTGVMYPVNQNGNYPEGSKEKYFYDLRVAQKEFLKTLKKDTSRTGILFHHINFFGVCSEGTFIKNPYFEMRDDYLNNLNIQLAFNGHIHNLQLVNQDTTNGRTITLNGENINYKNNYPIYICEGPSYPSGRHCDYLDPTGNYMIGAMTVLEKQGDNLIIISYHLDEVER
ncbi:MAG: metallophosphoesterase, partial [Bacteroidales bacterium]|nr:metallophosphoesterase [Bacteroidales bacterium]